MSAQAVVAVMLRPRLRHQYAPLCFSRYVSLGLLIRDADAVAAAVLRGVLFAILLFVVREESIPAVKKNRTGTKGSKSPDLHQLTPRPHSRTAAPHPPVHDLG